MYFISIGLIILLNLSILFARKNSGRHINIHVTTNSSEGTYCYRDSDGCGPNSDYWPALCKTGSRQSPIDLPRVSHPSGMIRLNTHAYRGNSFRIQNTGHTINVDFNGQNPSNQILTFPDPIDPRIRRQYRFASAHFHWGVSDGTSGSEHCVVGKCSVMELHVLHYLAKYSSPSAALNSSDENALSVIGVLLDIGKNSSGSLLPIAKNLNRVEQPTHELTQWTVVNEPLDLSRLISKALPDIYSYKGSLTSPGCNEQINWFVFRKAAMISSQESGPFRTMVRDHRDQFFSENHRPLQDTNGRRILLSKVLTH